VIFGLTITPSRIVAMSEKIESTKTNESSAIPAVPPDGMDRFAKSAHRGIEAASHAAHPAIDRMVSGAHKAVDNADDMASHAVKAFDQAGVKSQEVVAASTKYMREHPLLTLSVAVAAGYVLSRLLSSR
jgi:ElaB/YqjD/DUF883 family membrane-anchored ribosome-binding protein